MILLDPFPLTKGHAVGIRVPKISRSQAHPGHVLRESRGRHAVACRKHAENLPHEQRGCVIDGVEKVATNCNQLPQQSRKLDSRIDPLKLR